MHAHVAPLLKKPILIDPFFKIKNQIIKAKQNIGPKLTIMGLHEKEHCSD